MTRVGIIAEDNSDVDVANELLGKLISPKRFCVRHFAGDGCGKLRSKCGAWAHQLHLRGCSVLLLIHDLDERALSKLRTDLVAALGSCPITKHAIIIPIQEIEAWLMCDPSALKRVFSLKRLPKLPGNPEFVMSPKEKLESLVWVNSGKTRRYINTVHNSAIARYAAITSLRKCSAFRTFEQFVRSEIA